ncbi:MULTISPECIES: NADPH:quinone oxidoreductase family protein [unclassified Streptomyces]|uniref:quinone oxidoreductase family protein n=1 Tax=unclassified Streptomyces TaxID=2593676 RepID=UPI000889F1C6|nr:MULTISPECIES: NADPH:quinone oxidoreductase family protein [unclassified Streptomyces]PBC83039.1 NADPH:quinone reductase-like Zn-dependent oxidoreductase [Streptomyces sp. 2321.6]SDR45449.1 NADPH2:quinone reductase [Streptomyces sp. KS_16]SEC81652.1 NADPH2:quinone reductase [Streptomyces sp. 2133.1]SEE87367.1 NADPH2:quinone reductase [Streptomyces sp. 2112.3]SNC69117.1 NADPH2:quinone reductase [Streptomyces sp. 2114.4]
MRAMQFERFGDPEVLTEAEVPDPVAGPGETLVEVEAAGVNFGDIKHIAGEHTDGPYAPKGPLPHIPGMEVVGRTTDGRRVLGYVRQGGYAAKTVVADRDLVTTPPGVSAGAALALLVQGLTAWHLLRSVARVRPGESVVVHAAAGGTGSLAVQLAREFGAGRIIATTSSDEKRALALELGADAAIDGEAEGYKERVLDANQGRPVDIILDAIGGPVLDSAVDALGYLGRLVTYGASSRQAASAIAPSRLAVRSIGIAGFWITPLLARNGVGGTALEELLDLTAQGRLRPLVGAEYDLARARDAHEDLLGRRTKGKLVLRP